MRTLCFALSLAAAASDLLACNLPHQPLARSEVKSVQTEPAWWVSPAVSGAWVNAEYAHTVSFLSSSTMPQENGA